MRILFVHSGSDLYGASKMLLRLASRFVAEGNALLAVLPEDGPLRAELEKKGAQVVIHRLLPVVTRRKCKSLWGIFSLVFGMPLSVMFLGRIVAAFRPDVLHTNTALILSPGVVAKIMGVPHVWHIKESFIEFRFFFKAYQWYISILADKIICVSSPVKDQFQKWIRRKKVVLLYEGFPIEEFGPVEEEKISAFRDQFGLNGHPVVGVVGRIKFSRKGQDVFVRAAAMMKDDFPNVKFLIVGSPFPGNEEHLENLKKLVVDLGIRERVILTGDVSDIRIAYSALDISVLPSAFPEPFGGVVVESMAYGKPVVGTRIGGTIEQIEDGTTGLLVEPNNPEELARAITILLRDSNLRRKMGSAGRERFLRLFEFQLYYESIIGIYHDLLRKAQ